MNLGPYRRLRRFLPLTVAAAIGAGAGVGAYALSSHGSAATTTHRIFVPAQPASSTSTVDTLAQLYKKDAPGVVDITSQLPAGSGTSGFPFQPQPRSQKPTAEGAGFEIDAQGDILTAEHVVDGATSITVQFADGSSAKATLVGKDKSTDTAVIHVDVLASQLHPLVLGNSSSVQPGESVVAIGSPFGYTETMTAGIVSATSRTITAPNGFSITGAIQTDAAINHGNSGGPLIDTNTNTVIGINDQISSDTNDNAGIGFAVPINASKSVAQALIEGRTVRHAYMGVSTTGAATGVARVSQVFPGSPAAKAGLKAGDVITAFNGRSILNWGDLSAAVSAARPGQAVRLTIHRDGATKHLSVTLGVQPASPSS